MDYYSSPRWTNEVADCSMPMTFDTYSNCSFGCLYCFSQFQRALGKAKEAYLSKSVRAVDVDKIKRMFREPDRYAGQFAPYIKQRRVMQWGGLSDEFDGYERKYGKTLELLRFFKEIDYPLCFSTKATWWTKDDRYMDLVRGQKNWNFKFSIITLDEEKARQMERGVPTPLERLEAIQRIAEAGTRGATALSTEFMCVELRSKVLRDNMPIFNELCGFDFLEFYKRYSVSAGYLRLNRRVKEPFVRKMKEECDKWGMRFYVSDAHFKELCCNGSCCGLPEGWNYSRGQFCQALQIAKAKGEVRYADIRKDIDSLLAFPLAKASGYNLKSSENRAHFDGMTMAEYMRWLWNNPQAGQNLYRMFEGVVVPAGKDAEGNLIYKYKGGK